MKNKKIIFLDFDGVITTQKSRWRLDKEKLDLLGEIINATDAYIVISSSWSLFTFSDTIEYLSNEEEYFMNGMIFPYIDRVVGVTPRMYGFKHGVREEHFSISRGEEIRRWILENSSLACDYVILDDCDSILYTQKDNFVLTDTRLGLSNENVYKAIKILNKEVYKTINTSDNE